MRRKGIVVAVVAVILLGGIFWGAGRIHENGAVLDNDNVFETMGNLKLTSPAFEHEGTIPSKYTCDGERGLNPPLEVSGVPEGAVSLALIMDDPDVPKALRSDGVFDHWTLFNISPGTNSISEGEAPGVQGANGAGNNAYTGPCPPSEYEPSEHRYFFRVYALDAELSLSEGAAKQEILDAMEGHVLDKAELIGRYKRP